MSDASPASEDAGVRLRLHGSAQVVTASGRVLPLRGRAAALVALAVLEPGIARERAAALLWPEAANPRQNLRQQLLRFRQWLGRPLLSGDDALHLASGVVLESADPGAELLATEPAGHDAWGLWLSAMRHHQGRTQRQPLLEAMAAAEASGELDAAFQHAQALLALDPHEEAPHTALMRVHFLRGGSSALLAASTLINTGTITLQDGELGIAPGAVVTGSGSFVQEAGLTQVGGLLRADGGITINGGVLSETGTVEGDVTIGPGGVWKPGNSPRHDDRAGRRRPAGRPEIEFATRTQFDRLAGINNFLARDGAAIGFRFGPGFVPLEPDSDTIHLAQRSRHRLPARCQPQLQRPAQPVECHLVARRPAASAQQRPGRANSAARPVHHSCRRGAVQCAQPQRG